MPLQSAKNAAFVVRLLLQRQALAHPPRQSYTTSTILAFPSASSSSSSSTSDSETIASDPFLEDENPSEYEHLRAALPERNSTARPIPWPTVFAPKHERDARLPSASKRHLPALDDQTLPCTPLYRLVLRKDYDSASALAKEMHTLGVPILPRQEYRQVARARLLESPPDQDGFLRFLAVSGYKHLLKPDLLLYLRENHTTDISFLRRIVFTLAELGHFGDACLGLILHLAVVAPPDVTFNTLSHALKLEPGLNRGNPALHNSRGGYMWNKIIRKVAAAGHRSAANRMYQKMVDSSEPFRWESLTERVLSKPDFQRIQGFPTLDPDDTPTGWLIKRMRYAARERVKPRDLRGILEDLRSLDPARPTLHDRFRSRFIRDRLVVATEDHPTEVRPKDIWTNEQARRVWAQAEISLLQRQGRHNEAITYFRGHCIWYGLPMDPVIEALPIAANTFRRDIRPNAPMNNTVLRSILQVLPRDARAIAQYYHSLLDMTRDLSPSVRPDRYTHGIVTSFVHYHFGGRAAANLLRYAERQGHVVGTYPFERMLELAAWRGDDIDRKNGLLRAMENGRKWLDLLPGKPSAEFYERLEKIQAQRALFEGRSQEAGEKGGAAITLRRATFWEPKWLEEEEGEDHENPVDDIASRDGEGSHQGERVVAAG